MEHKYFDFTFENGLVFCQNINDAKNNAELLYIHDAKKLNATAVFFRRFYKNGEGMPYQSEPSVCIFQVEDHFFNSNEHIDLHAKLWSSTKNEIYILNGTTRIDIINARKPAEANINKELTIDNLLLASSDALRIYNDKRFSAHLFESGTFWEQSDFENKLQDDSSPYIYLLRYLMNVRRSLQKNEQVELLPATIDKLLVVCILIKFLEEIRDDHGKHTLKDIYIKLNTKDLAEAIAKRKLITLLNELTNEFNGKIFDKFSESEKISIENSDLSIISNFLHGNIELQTNQYFLWKQYDFKYLPVEVISAIYENFIQAEAKRENGQTEKGVVYTPTYLVNFLIDEAMPLESAYLFKEENFKVLDPSCGSGVFLVGAFKRLLQWWAINNSKDGKIKYPKSKQAQKILEDNIFGVDVKETATFVTIFSLTTALLDKLSPQEIWNNLKFEDLSVKNIQSNNFFDWALNAKETGQSFDLIIGNPPFNVETGKSKSEILNSAVLARLNLKHKKIPNNNFALHFFESSMLLTRKICLIIPSNVLLYSKSSQDYRNKIFTNYSVNKLFDFTHLRRDLFHKTADTPVVAIIAENKMSEKLKIEHTVIKRTISFEKKIRFEIDYYDRHFVPWNWAVDPTKEFVWKTNLLGGGRLFHLIYRFSLLPTLKSFINKQENWKSQRGFEGGNKIVIKDQDQIVGIADDGKPTIINATITTNNLKDKDIYSSPFIIFEQTLGIRSLKTCFVSSVDLFTKNPFLYYSRNYVGIVSPKSGEEILRRIYNLSKAANQIDRLSYQMYAVCISSNCLILHETAIRQNDILNLPFPAEDKELSISNEEKLLQDDVLNYYIHLGKAISKRGGGYKLHKEADAKQIELFGKNFCETLNFIYAQNGKSWQAGNVYRTTMFTIYQFGYGKNDGLRFSLGEDLGHDDIEILVKDKLSNCAAIYNRVVTIYKHINGYDCLFLIKPNTLRYWLNSIALRDADDTFMTLKNAGF